MVKTVKVGIIGFGTVGAGAAVNLLKNHDVILERTNVDVKLVKIADKDITSDRGVKVPAELLTTSVDELIAASDIVVELIGGTTIAGDFILKALFIVSNCIELTDILNELIIVFRKLFFHNFVKLDFEYCGLACKRL